MRLNAEERRAQILSAAEKLLLSQGYLPLPVEALAGAVGTSKALIYSYFTSQHDLFNTVLCIRLEELTATIGKARSRKQGLKAGLCAEAELYMKHVAAAGPVVQWILRDSFMAGNVRGDVHSLRMSLTQPVVRRLKRALKMRPEEAVAACHLLATIPEEVGVQAYRGQITLPQARELCCDLVSAVIDGLRGGKT